MKIRALSLLGIALLAAACAKVPVIGKALAGDDLPRRVSEARIVLVGKMLSLDERAVTDEEQELVNGQLLTRLVWYDVAAIEVIEILKGACDSGRVFVKFLSFDQTQFRSRAEVDCRFFSEHDIWNPGIWLIDIDKDHEPPLTVQRGNYEPMIRLDDVKAALNGSTKTSGKEKRSVYGSH
jgi:hypothetical protein